MASILSNVKSLFARLSVQLPGISDPVNYKRIMSLSNDALIEEFNKAIETDNITWSQEKLVYHHPLWQNTNFIKELNIDTTQKVLDLITLYAAKYAPMTRFARTHHRALVNNLPMVWSTPPYFNNIQKHILEVMDPRDRQTLLPSVQGILMLTHSYEDQANAWLKNAEQFLSHGGQLSWTALASAMYYNSSTAERNPLPINQFPQVIHFFNTAADDELLISFSTSGIPAVYEEAPPATWLFKTHPQANAWYFGDNPRMKYRLADIADSLPDKELFKAWHGLELTSEEIRSNPNAQLLYAYKHAKCSPNIEPLPSTWSAALALAQTGMQFKEMLGMYEHSNEMPTTFTLPSMMS